MDQNLTDIKKRILSLLKTNKDNKLSIAITGGWGVGKTYFWEHNIQPELKKEGKKLVYVSLYGIGDYTKLLNQVALKSLSLFNKGVKGVKNLFGKIKGVGIAGFSIEVDLQSSFSALDTNFTDNIVVCFDDLERKPNELSMDDFFGLVTYLRDVKKCHVIVIYNEEQTKENKDTLVNHKEKSINYIFHIEQQPDILNNIFQRELKDLDFSDTIINYLSKNTHLSSNLRYWLKTIQHIKYIFKECNFKQFSKKDNNEVFNRALFIIIDDICAIEYTNKEKAISWNPASDHFIEYSKTNILSKKNVSELEELFKNIIESKINDEFVNVLGNYTYSNLSDQDFIKTIDDNVHLLNESNFAYLKFDFFLKIFDIYEKIKGVKLEQEIEIRKRLILYFISKSNDRIDTDFWQKQKEELIDNNEELKNYFDTEEKKFIEHNKLTMRSLLTKYPDKKIYEAFNSQEKLYIYNKIDIDDIVNEFKTNKDFFDIFIHSYLGVGNALIDINNNLFKAFIKIFEDKNYKVKKQYFIEMSKFSDFYIKLINPNEKKE